jgi:predicted permease
MRWWQIGKRRADLDRELQSDLELEEQEQRERGLSDEDATYAARRAFGNTTVIHEQTREAWGGTFVEHLWQDIHFAFRQVSRSKRFATIYLLTLALGIGATAAMFTIVDRVILRPVPYKDPNRLMVISESNGRGTVAWLAPWLDIEQWMKHNRSFQQIGFSTGMFGRNYLEGGTAALLIHCEQITPNLFDVLGVRPALGRGFVPETPSFGAHENAGKIVLSDGVWKEAFGGDRRIIGQEVKLNGASYTVVGVMPAGFRYPNGAALTSEVWTAVQLGETDKGPPRAPAYQAIGRLKPGISAKTANVEMSLIQNQAAAAYSDPNLRQSRSAIKLESYRDWLVNAGLRSALLALLAASSLLWLIAAMNGTNLLLARCVSRQREIAMRTALGASRWRVVQQMMVEGLVLSATAALAGLGLAVVSIKLLAHELSQYLPVAFPTKPNGLVLLGLLALTLVSGILSAIWPTIYAVRAPIEPALKSGGVQTGLSRQHHQLRSALVAAEVAMSLVLLAACGLLLQTIYRLGRVPLGYRTDHIIVADLDIPAFRFSGRNMTETLYEPMLERIQNLRGVESAGLINEVPLSGTRAVRLEMKINASRIVALMKAVSPGIQQVFQFHMAAGRFFNSGDTATSQPVVVVNQAFARLYAPDKHDPSAILGTQLLDLRENAHMQIVGILDDELQSSVADAAQPEVEVAIPQVTPDSMFYMGLDGTTMDVAVRTELPVSQMVPELRTILRQQSPEFQSATVTTMDEVVAESYGSQRLAAHILEIFGGSALLLSMTGLYGLLAYLVTQRTRELGVRIALGAGVANVVWLVMRQACVMLLVGVAVGWALALASAGLLRGFIYGVSVHDGFTLIGAVVLLVACGLTAAFLPAWRASQVDPVEALRSE